MRTILFAAVMLAAAPAFADTYTNGPTVTAVGLIKTVTALWATTIKAIHGVASRTAAMITSMSIRPMAIVVAMMTTNN